MATAAEITAADTGITGFSGAGGTLIRFDTRQPEARKAILASLDRLASMAPKAAPIVVTDEHRAAALVRSPQAHPKTLETLALIEATFFGGRAAR